MALSAPTVSGSARWLHGFWVHDREDEARWDAGEFVRDLVAPAPMVPIRPNGRQAYTTLIREIEAYLEFWAEVRS
jgi:hypothetical protein